jgi:hypothetical protein
MGDALISRDKRRAVRLGDTLGLCYRGQMGANGFQGHCVGVVPGLDAAMAFLDGKSVEICQMSYPAWDDWAYGDNVPMQ